MSTNEQKLNAVIHCLVGDSRSDLLQVRRLSYEITSICLRTLLMYDFCLNITKFHHHICSCKCAVSHSAEKSEEEKPRPGLSPRHVVICFINVLTGSLDYNLSFVMDNIECKRFAEGGGATCKAAKIIGPQIWQRTEQSDCDGPPSSRPECSDWIPEESERKFFIRAGDGYTECSAAEPPAQQDYEDLRHMHGEGIQWRHIESQD